MNEDKKKELVAGVFGRGAEGYGDIEYFPIYGQRLVEIAGVTAEAFVLDVACGRGAVLFPAAERVGSGGRVNGVDISPGMVRETMIGIARRGVVNASAVVMDAEALEFHDGYFDFVLCAFSLQFFPDSVRALKEFRRVLKADGTVAVSTWGQRDAKWEWWDAALPGLRDVIGLRSAKVDTPERVADLFRDAGFDDVIATVETADFVYPTRGSWWNKSWSLSARVALERLEEEEMRALRDMVEERLDALEESDGWHEVHEVIYTVRKKSED